MKRAFKTLSIFLSAIFLLAACTLDDQDSDEWRPKTETWRVTIEPEYVIGYSYWGAYTGCSLQMESVNEKGERNGTYFPGEIVGFEFEEGYRYQLLVDATTTDPRIADSGSYSFKLRKLVSKDYVGIRTEGQREVTMDVRTVLMTRPNELSSEGYYYLCGRSIDGSETLDMGMMEIMKAEPDLFFKYDYIDAPHRYSCRMKLTITPAERPVFGSHQYRIRLKELISQQELPGDSIVRAATDEEYEAKHRM